MAIPYARLHIAFDEVKVITPDAPLALLGTLQKFASRAVRGSVPKLPEPKEVLEQSGFFDHVKHEFDLQGAVEGAMSQYSGTKVAGDLARNLILRGTEALFGNARDSEASYSILVEGMENTIAHGRQEPKNQRSAGMPESWWASVYVDHSRNRICFVVVDVGVGILRSAKVRLLRRIDRLFRKRADADILADIFAGLLESRTGLDNRGKGLPAIKRLSDAGAVKSLVVVTNTVHVDFDTNAFTTMLDSYTGTLIYWEIGE